MSALITTEQHPATNMFRTKQASNSQPNEFDPTSLFYTELDIAYKHFNKALFGGALPACLMTLQRRHCSPSYFKHKRFKRSDGSEVIDEIALNPQYFLARGDRLTLASLVREMTTQWQHEFGSPARPGYYNREWKAAIMAIGLRFGAKNVSDDDVIIPGGPFEFSCQALISDGFTLEFVEARFAQQTDAAEDTKKDTKTASKTKFSCPRCRLNAWAKPDAQLMCASCAVVMDAQSSH